MKSLKKKLYVLIYFIFFQTFFSGTAMAATLRINAPKILLELTPGETYSGEIVAENPTEEAIKMKAYLEDWVYSTGGTGEKEFIPAGTTPLSCSKWITFSPAEEEMKPFGRVITRYNITVPPDAKGGYYSVLFFETIIGTTKDEEGVSIVVSGRISSFFFVEVKGTVDRKGEIESVEIKPPKDNKPMEIYTTFKNSGNVDISLKGNFLIMDSAGLVKGRGDLTPIYVFKDQAETRKTEWVGRLPKGAYQLLLTYDLGKGKNLVEEKTFSILE